MSDIIAVESTESTTPRMSGLFAKIKKTAKNIVARVKRSIVRIGQFLVSKPMITSYMGGFCIGLGWMAGMIYVLLAFYATSILSAIILLLIAALCFVAPVWLTLVAYGIVL